MRFSRFAAAVIILAAGLAGEARVEVLQAWAAQRGESNRKEFDQFPPTVGAWRLETQTLSDREEELLYVDDYLRADFVNADGTRLRVYVGYYASPERATQHPPTICYPGAGWQKSYESDWDLRVAGVKPTLKVRATAFQKDDLKELVVYWYSMSGYTGANASWQRLMRLKNILFGRATPSASKVQIAVNVETTVEDAKGTIEGFLAEFLPVLDGFLPGQQTDGS
jgi:EpsI family protein